MSFRFQGFSVVGTLVVFVCLQGCASRPVTAPPQSPKVKQEAPIVVQPPPEPAQTPAPFDKAVSSATPVSPSAEPASSLSPNGKAPEIEKQSSQHGESAQPKPAAKPTPAPPAQPMAIEQPGQPSAKPESATPLKPRLETDASDNSAEKKSPSTPPKPSLNEQNEAALLETAEKPSPVPPAEPAADLPEVAVALEALPIDIESEWKLSASGDSCTLSTPVVSFDDGQGMSKMELIFTPHHWLIKTGSDIDASYNGTGLTIDEGSHFPLDQIVRESDVMFTKDYAAITQAILQGRSLRITLGFWPSWPITETKTIHVPLTHFARAHRAWKLCQSLINAR